MWGSRVVVPAKLRERVLEMPHKGHIGMVKIKGLSPSFVWCPNTDKDIEGSVRNCEGCQELANNPAYAPLHRWEYPFLPWQKRYIDFAGLVQRKMPIVEMVAHSKCPEIFVMENTSAEETVSTLRSLTAWDSLTRLYQTMVHSSYLKPSGSLQLRTVLSMSLVHLTTHQAMVRRKDWYRVSRKELRLISLVQTFNTSLIGFC